MTPDELKYLLQRYKQDKITEDDFLNELKHLPYTGSNFFNLDYHRHIRTGFPEVVFCLGKKEAQAIKIITEILNKHKFVLATHARTSLFKKVKKKHPAAIVKEEASAIIIDTRKKKPKSFASLLSVVTAGTADIPVAEEACLVPELMGVPIKRFYDIGVAGLHRFLEKIPELSNSSIIIVIAGMDGVLPGVIAGVIDAPIIGVPTSIGYGTNLKGFSPLLTMLNSCSAGLAVMNIDNGFGAGVLATNIIRKFEGSK